MQIEDLNETLKYTYGFSDEEIAEDAFQHCLRKSVKKLSEYFPYKENDFVETVAGQTKYTIIETDLIRIVEVHYRRSGGVCSDIYDDPDLRNAQRRGSSYSPSSQFTDIVEKAMYDKMNPVGASVDNHNEFSLLPTPTETGVKIYYEYERFRTLAEVPDVFEDELIKLLMYYMKEEEYNKSLRDNGGNVYSFDRRGNVRDTGESKTAQETKEEEFNLIIKAIKIKAMRLLS